MRRYIIGLLEIQLLIIGITIGTPVDIDKEWSEFKVTYNKTYDNPSQELRRREIFLNNLIKVHRSQELYDAGLETYWLGLHEYSDLTTEEHMDIRGLRYINLGDFSFGTEMNTEYEAAGPLPDSVDWRKKGACNVPRLQGLECNDCSAFATVEAVESHYYLHVNNSKLLSLSIQNLDDCGSLYGFSGCRGGGSPHTVLQYIQHQGIELEEDYPYKGTDGPCRFIDWKKVLQVKDFKKIDNDEAQIQAAVATKGPVIVAIEANVDWASYKGGILKAKTPYDYINHVVLVDGYGTENGVDYWLLRNSWGTKFGENGYLRIRRHTKDFGFGKFAYYPIF